MQDVDAVWKVVRAAKPDVVFNLAAISSPAVSAFPTPLLLAPFLHCGPVLSPKAVGAR